MHIHITGLKQVKLTHCLEMVKLKKIKKSGCGHGDEGRLWGKRGWDTDKVLASGAGY